MARMTNAERQAETQRLREHQEAHNMQNYQSRLMATRRRASALHLTLSVNEWFNFVVYTNDREWHTDSFTLGLEYTKSSFGTMQMLEDYLDHREYEAKEAARKADLRKNALEKLTKEEREALGV